MGGDFLQQGGQGGGVVSLNIIIMWGGGGGGGKLIFGFWVGGYDSVLGHISPISQPPPPPGNYCTVS